MKYIYNRNLEYDFLDANDIKKVWDLPCISNRVVALIYDRHQLVPDSDTTPRFGYMWVVVIFDKEGVYLKSKDFAWREEADYYFLEETRRLKRQG